MRRESEPTPPEGLSACSSAGNAAMNRQGDCRSVLVGSPLRKDRRDPGAPASRKVAKMRRSAAGW